MASLGTYQAGSPKAPSSMQEELKCKFQFLLMIRKDTDTVEDDLEDTHAEEIVRQVLQEPLVLVCDSCKAESKLSLIVDTAHVDNPRNWGVGHDHTVWTQQDEVRLMLKDIDYYDIHPIELQSRKFEVKKKNKEPKARCKHAITIAEEITAVFTRLSQRFRNWDKDQNEPRKYYMHVNKSCGFQVQVTDKGRPLPFMTIQKMFCLFVACERQIDQLHSKDRITCFDLMRPPHGLPKHPFPHAPVLDAEKHNVPCSMMFMAEANRRRWEDLENSGQDFMADSADRINEFCMKTPALQPPYSDSISWTLRRLTDIDSWIALIRSCNSVKDMKELFRAPGMECTLNLDNIPDTWPEEVSEVSGKLYTLEFRQHRGTLQLSEIVGFLDFTLAFSRFCHLYPTAEFYGLIKRNGFFRQPEFDIHALCEQIRCSSSTRKYYLGLLDSRKDMYSHWVSEQIRRLEKLKSSDPIMPLAIHSLKEVRENTKQSSVQERIALKILCGGYGQFTDKALNSILPKDIEFGIEAVEHLRLGHITPLKHLPDDQRLPVGFDVEGYSSDSSGDAPVDVSDGDSDDSSAESDTFSVLPDQVRGFVGI